jgi:hypothetical protein
MPFIGAKSVVIHHSPLWLNYTRSCLLECPNFNSSSSFSSSSASNQEHIFPFIGFDSLRGLGIFLFTTASRTALGPTQPPIQWVRGVLSIGLKRPGREADHLPPSNVEVKE